MKQRVALAVIGWMIGQNSLLGTDITVQGSLVGTDGARLSGHVIVVSGGTNATMVSFQTNGDGSYSFPVEYSERMIIVAAATGYASEEHEIESLPDSQKIEINFTLPLTGGVGGWVVDSTGKPQPGASVRIRYLDRKRRVHMGHGVNAKVDDAGAFAIFSVARGRRFVIDAVADTWLPASSTVQTLDSESATRITVRLTRRGHTVRGRVVDGLGEPLANLMVRIEVKGGEVVGNEALYDRARLRWTQTDPEGRYEFSGLPSGNAIVVVSRPGSSPVGEGRELKESDEDFVTEIDFVIP